MQMTARQNIIQKGIIIIGVVGPLLGVLTAIVLLWNRYVFWQDMVLLMVFWILTSFGVTVGYHRMLTHRGFDAPPILKGLLLILGVMSMEGGPVGWAATHTCHHAHSDEEGDPHSPLEGFWHAHIGWMFRAYGLEDPKEYVPHLLEDPVVMFVDRHAGMFTLLSLMLPLLLGGWTGFVWGGLVRIFITTHSTWSVNSICHTFGRRPFDTADCSRNHWLVGLLAFGEGWHNNHHAFPLNAFHGMGWWQIDVSGWMIRGLEMLGLVWNVQRIKPEALAAFSEHAQKRKERIMDLKKRLGTAIIHAEEEACTVFARVIDESLSSFEKDQCRTTYEEYLRRLWEIRSAIQESTLLKKKRLYAYLQEVQTGAKRVREMMQRKLVRS